MITRRHYCVSVEMVAVRWMGSLDSDISKQQENIPN